MELDRSIALTDHQLSQLIQGYDPNTRRRWIQWAWGLLSDPGADSETLDPDHPDHTDLLITAAALVDLLESFEDHLDGVYDTEPPIPDLLQGSEALSPVEIGRLAERAGVYSSELPETADAILSELIRDRRTDVARELARRFGTSWLAGTMYAVRRPDTTFPLKDEDLREIVNSPTADLHAAYEWLDELV